MISIRKSAAPEKTVAALDVEQDVVFPRWLDEQGSVLLLGLKDGQALAWRWAAPPDGSDVRPACLYKFDTPCSCFAIGGNGQWIAACSEGESKAAGRIRIWQATKRPFDGDDFPAAYREYGTEIAAHPYVWCVALVRDGRDHLVVATGGRPREVHLWDAETGTLINKMTGHRNAIRDCVALSEHLLVTASDDMTVRIWDVIEQEELCILYRSERLTPRVAVQGTTIAVSDGETLTVLDTADVERVIASNRGYEQRRLSKASP